MMAFLCLLAVFGAILAYYIYIKGNENSGYFEGKGVKHLKSYFILGSVGKAFWPTNLMTDVMKELYQNFPGEK